MGPRERVAAFVLSVGGLIAGVAGFVVARDVAFLDPTGAARIRFQHSNYLVINRFGALVTVGLACLALVGIMWRLRALLVAVGIGFALATALTIVQVGRDPNWLGGRGNTLSLFMALSVGFLALSLAASPSDPAPPVSPGDSPA